MNVLCVHNGDWVKLDTTDMDKVLNNILDIFDDYNTWSETLTEAFKGAGPMQQFIDISQSILPFPIFITDNRGNVIAFSKNYGVGEVDEYWDSILLHGETHRQIFSGNARNADNERVTDWDSKAKIYNSKYHKFVGVHLVLDNEIVGSIVIIELGTQFNNGQCQIADAFCESATAALAQGNSDAELRTGSAMITDLLQGREPDPIYIEGYLNRLTDESTKIIILCNNVMRSDFNYKNSFATRISRSGIPCFTMVYEDYVLVIVQHGKEIDMIKGLKEKNLDEDTVFGISLPFTSALLLPGAFRQAELALERGDNESGSVNKCVNYVYAYLLDLLNKDINLSSDMLHPALGILSRYDAMHKSDLFNTLYTYLTHERNVVKTAKILFIHRNSLLYRLQRIGKFIDLDLEDFNVRMYLLLSYQIEKQRKKSES